MLASILLILFISIKPSFENYTIVFQSGEAGYYCIRIPSVLTTVRGILLAFDEARMYTCSDNTANDIVYKRSVDNGKTWSDLQILYRGNSTNNDYNLVRNFAPVQLKYNQRVLIPLCKKNLILIQTYSDDDDLTFSSPEIISNVIKPEWQAFLIGPLNGLLLQSNRILIPAHYALNTSASGAFSYSTIRVSTYSNDGGITFNNVNVLNTLIQPLHAGNRSDILSYSDSIVFTILGCA
jgi:sialidase-1